MNKMTLNISREYVGVSKLSSFRFYEDGFEGVENRYTKEKYLELKNVENVYDIKFFKYNFCTEFIDDNVSKLEITVDGKKINAETYVLGYNLFFIYLILEEFDLESGRMFENNDECIISKNTFAVDEEAMKWNAVKLGDKITIKNDNGIYKEFLVVGIQKQDEEDTLNTNRRMIHTTLESAEYFDKITPKRAGGYGYEPYKLEEGRKFILMKQNY